jgi:hypothetical protein
MNVCRRAHAGYGVFESAKSARSLLVNGNGSLAEARAAITDATIKTNIVLLVVFVGLLLIPQVWGIGVAHAATAKPDFNLQRSVQPNDAKEVRGTASWTIAGMEASSIPPADGPEVLAITNEELLDRINEAVNDALEETPSRSVPVYPGSQGERERAGESRAPDPAKENPYLDELRDEAGHTIVF